MLASPLYVQGREDYESSRMPIAPGKLAALFSFGNEDPFNNSVFRNADPSNVGRSLLEGNKDTIPMPTFTRRLSTMSSLIPVEFPQKIYSWTAKTAHFGTAIRQIP